MKKISILLSIYNGKEYLNNQLKSLTNQCYKNIEIIARDDLSKDNTLEILKSNKIKIIESKNNLGAKKSFMELLRYSIEKTDSYYFMFYDQDDIWNKDKIEKTINKMKNLEKKYKNTPILIHTDLEVVDENLNTINQSFMKYQNINPYKNKFNNLLMQNTITVCTVMINKELAIKYFDIPNDAIIHDWWIGLVASKFGIISYLDESTIKYRQHNKSVVGAKNFNIKFIWQNILKKINIDDNILQSKVFLEKFKNELDEKSIRILKDFSKLNQKNWIGKRIFLLKHGILKHDLIRNIALLLKL